MFNEFNERHRRLPVCRHYYGFGSPFRLSDGILMFFYIIV
ncbi:hypothetical protein NEIELOOT_01511 [Neisseria elongata subsp. glycolytica ATCC 29315]|uniref:Uncharacterized protein n=1 Tax=Neisseria elongata subsp. glycolytica ATCC 29315 TaxID=546263 RepID=D4DR18_NEIEG|nr:hypothetical protein NEIELOOT_01511 [Neisseria elongata subsp. glycolytica ATCC 29315]